MNPIENSRARNKFHSVAALIAVAMLAFTAAARAQLLAYEGFNYPAGTKLNGQGTGFGWAGAWQTSPVYVTNGNDNAVTNGSMKPGGLAFSGGRLVTKGNDVRSFRQFDTSPGSAAALAGVVNTNGQIGVSNKTVWIGFMAALSPGTNTPTGNGGFHVFDGLGDLVAFPDGDKSHHEILFLGDRNNPTTGLYWCLEVTSGGSGSADSTVLVSTNQHFLVYKIDFLGARNGRVTLYIDPVPGTTPSNAAFAANIVSSTTVQTNFQFNYLEVGSANGSPVIERLDLDEFRMGITFADIAPPTVLPTPATPTPGPLTNGGFRLSWPTVADYHYQTEYSPDLASWFALGVPVLSSGTNFVWTDDGTLTGSPPGTATKRFYRVRTTE